ncbi:hypothetical protein ABZ734_13170 [Streptomyces sp. NPDC006660]|uniref:hypothetical protein n=1 Tax=Streptomyces sp. NPDC006660 TaxID=3156901 RepID=UPI0033D44D29
MEESVHDGLRAGPRGWAVSDCVVTLVRSGFSSVFSTAGDFRALTRIVLDRALRSAGTRLYEPCLAYELEAPGPTLAAVCGRLTAMGAAVEETVATAEGWLLRGTVAARGAAGIERWLPGLTHGEGIWWTRPAGDRPMVP